MKTKINLLLVFISMTSCSQEMMLSNQVSLDCILSQPLGEVPENLYLFETIQPSSDYPPFTKKLTVCGITLVAQDEISDSFMKDVAQTVADMFTVDNRIDVAMQEKLLTNERHEAWENVARKLAHEIKNPLTPIQLTIDNLKTKYLPNVCLLYTSPSPRDRG